MALKTKICRCDKKHSSDDKDRERDQFAYGKNICHHRRFTNTDQIDDGDYQDDEADDACCASFAIDSFHRTYAVAVQKGGLEGGKSPPYPHRATRVNQKICATVLQLFGFRWY